METKRCSGCHNDLPLENFAANKSAKDGLNWCCRDCAREASHRHYERNKERVKENTRRWKESYKQKLRTLLTEYFSEHFCPCGERRPWCLTFHHTDPSQKEFKVADAFDRCYPLEKVIAEIKKCIVLCHNCHAEVHGKDRWT